MPKQEIIDFFISLWTEKELELLTTKYKNKIVTLREAIEETYSSFYLIYLSEQEIKEFLKEEVAKYRKILDKSTRVLVKASIVQGLNKTLFININEAINQEKFLSNLLKGNKKSRSNH